MFLASLYWVLLGHTIESFAMLFLIQREHTATFGIFHALSINYIHQYFCGRHQGRGQVYNTLPFL